ncbi:MAG: HWE histidine kinase domain-containing protein [Pseudorhodoplanes sp.]
MIADSVRRLTGWRLRPYSWRAFALSAACVAVAVGARIAIGLINPSALTFASYFPAVLIAALVGGMPAGIFAIVLSILSADWLFVRSDRDWPLDILNYAFFVLVCAFIIGIAHAYRRAVANYQAEERQKNLMLRELEHRGKNTFSVVESIVIQTLHDDKEKANVIVGRIRAVSSTNDIISHAADLQPDLRTLIRAKFEPFGQFRANLDGSDVRLPSDVARNLSLVFHELVTNAIKHGALSRSEGRVEIGWRKDPDGGLTLQWTERGGPPASPPEQRGFGTRLVVGCMRNLGGRVDAEFPPEGMICTLKIPPGRTGG